MLDEAKVVTSQIHEALMSGQILSNVKDSQVAKNGSIGGADILSAGGVLGLFGQMVRNGVHEQMDDRRRLCTRLHMQCRGSEAVVMYGAMPFPTVQIVGAGEGMIIPDSMALDHPMSWIDVEFHCMDEQRMQRMHLRQSVSNSVLFGPLSTSSDLFSSGYDYIPTHKALRPIVEALVYDICRQIDGVLISSYRRSANQVGINV